ncbi:MAG TPA: type II CRISPR RNA-guided endonuclease Cas9, partial [Spirochaetia bacterium]|nr:type II CRISPR RNA-guided endonuclease Cas9 [Spirochaetia bacterium]
MNQPLSSGYDLGLDIGIASVGWCVLGDDRIIDLGVRTFDKAETTEGESLNKIRRDSRLSRRRIRRRATRLLRLARLLKQEGLISSVAVIRNGRPHANKKAEDDRQLPTPWEMRAKGLDAV